MSEDDLLTEEHLIEVVENQLAENNPKRVKETLMRLTLEGMERELAMELIACALSVEIVDVLQNGKPFDNARYDRNLDLLPETPWMN